MELINKIIERCINAGADQAEVYSLKQNSMSISVRDGIVETVTKSTPGGLAIRFFKEGKSSFGHTTDLSDMALKNMISKLRRMANSTEADEYAILPKPGDDIGDLDLYDGSWIDATMDQKIEYLLSLEALGMSFDPLIKQSGGVNYRESVTTKTIANSNGLKVSYESTSYNVGCSLIAVNDDEKYSGDAWLSSRYFNNLPTQDNIIEQCASKAIRLLGGTEIKSGDYEIILSPDAGGSLLWGLNFALNGDNVLKSASFLTGKQNQKIASEKLTLTSNPLMKRGIDSRPFDDEGVTSTKTTFIENGVLQKYMYDTKTATKAETVSTSSCSRESYNSNPEIGPSDFHFQAGVDKIEDVVASCKRGIIVETTHGWGLHSVTGQYSAGINGTLVLNGKRIKPVANVTIAGDSESVLNNIGAVCDNLTFYGGFNSPSIMIKSMKVGS